MRYLFFLFVILTFCCFHLSGKEKETSIIFSDSSYARQTIHVLANRNPLLDIPDTLASQYSENGEFTLHFLLNKIEQVYFHAGIFRCNIYVVPGNIYHIKVPPFKEKKTEDKINPFFTPEDINLFVEKKINTDTGEELADSMTLNFLMYQSKAFYNELSRHISSNIRHRYSASEFDSVYHMIIKKHMIPEHPFIQENLYYRTAYLKSIAMKYSNTYIAEQYFSENPIRLNIPGYTSLFNFTFHNYLHTLSRQQNNKINKTLIEDSSKYEKLYTLLKETYLQTDSLTQLILLKNIIEEKNRDNFKDSSLDALLDSLIYHDSSKFTDLAIFIKNHLNHLKEGTKAPELRAKTPSGNKVSLKDYKGQYIYLGFCTLNNYECLKQFKVVDGFYHRFEKKISVIIVLTDPLGDVKDFVEQNEFEWDILHWDGCQQCLQNYRVKAYPTYYFIDRDGILLFSPAPTPTDRFESRIFQILRSKRIL